MYLSNIGGVFMIEQQQKLMLSPYMEIYELVIPKDNLLRQIKELVDFSFIYDELLANYCLDNGRNAVPPIRMFKYLLLNQFMIYQMLMWLNVLNTICLLNIFWTWLQKMKL